MSITATVEKGYVLLPPGLNLPDGTEVEIFVRAKSKQDRAAKPVSLPTFDGGGLQPGVNLNDSRGLRQLLDDAGKLSQLG